MNSFKLLVVFILLLFGSFAQRFQRHSNNGIKNGYVNGNTQMDNLDNLASDVENYEQNGGDVKFVGNERKGIELELENKELAFKFCSRGCMDKEVIACYDSTNSNPLRQGDCNPGQCEFRAGVKKVAETNFLWFTSSEFHKVFEQENICATAIMEYPQATPEGILPFLSCEPLKHDGNVVKLYVNQVPPGCPFYVENAKKWIPPPPSSPSPTQNSTDTNQTTSKSSEANITLWIGIGVGIFILLIVLIGFGYCCYRTQIQKKPLFGKQKDVQQKANISEAPKKAKAAAEIEKTADEKEVLKPEKVVAKPEPPKEATAATEKPPKPTKKTIPKEMKAPVVVPKPSKEVTREDNPPPAKKVSAEPTRENPTIEASVVQKSIVQPKQQKPGNPPRVFVPKNVILPAPKCVNAAHPKSKSLSGRKDSLSGRHEIGMQIMVQSSPESVKHHDSGMLNAETKEKLEKFYPPGPVRIFDRREIEMLCCPRISVMFKAIEALIDITMKALSDRGVKFDEKCNIIEMSPKAERYLQKNTTPEFVRAFAFGSIFREIIDSQSNVHESFSIPLLFSIVLQRRYSVINRRQACTWIRRQLPIIQKEFSAEERSKLAFPICAIEAAYKMNSDGFENVFLLDSLSGVDDDETQHSRTEKLGKK